MEFAVGLVGEHAEVVDLGCFVVGSVRFGFWSGGWVGVPSDHVGNGGADGTVFVEHVDLGEVERVEDQLDVPSDEGGIDLVAVGVEADGRGFGDEPGLCPQERFTDRLGCGQHRRRVANRSIETFDRCLSGFGVDLPVVVLFDPSGEEPFEFGHRLNTIGEELDLELVTDRPEEPFDLPPSGWFAWFGVPQADPHFGECAPELC